MRPWFAGLCLMLAGCAQHAAAGVTLTPLWTLGGLSSPESVQLSADGAFFYVSNVGGEGDVRDGDGFIAKVSRDGKLITRQWAKGFDAPKGLALRDGRLFVTDIDRVAEIDAATGAIHNTYPVEGAKFLNDAALAPDGAVLVSDSGTSRIYRLAGGTVSVWLEAPQLRSINGLLPERGRLVVTTMQGLLLAVDWKTKAVTQLAAGLGAGDGVAALGGGRYLVSEWPGRLFEVSPDGAQRTLIDSRKGETYINDILFDGDVLVTPNWKPGSLTAYKVAR
ncbi:MAG: SMP-30/gluconolactonase/LRE family protein [Caulobacteraceae bacterium]